jgi:hemerythrin-like domain-containing protein
MLGLFGSQDSSNAIDLLKRDHADVTAMFKDFESRKDEMRRGEKESLVASICEALAVHATIEEELFYPAVRRALGEDAKDLVDEAAVEHQTLKDIIARLEAAPTSDPLYDAGVKVLSEYVQHHVKEEENELFPKVKSSDLDLDALGEKMADRKAGLTLGVEASATPQRRQPEARVSH